MAKKTKKIESQISDYPPLDEWLEKLHARPLAEIRGENGVLYAIFAYRAATFIVAVYNDGAGWDLFTTHASNSIPLALADAEARIGFVDAVPQPPY